MLADAVSEAADVVYKSADGVKVFYVDTEMAGDGRFINNVLQVSGFAGVAVLTVG